MIRIHLLTHQRELERPTNTGQLAIELFPHQVTRVIWSRVTPAQNLQRLAETNEIALIHPTGKPLSTIQTSDSSAHRFKHFVLLDATWQEAQKILNRSNYLKQLEVFSLNPESPSKYQLRRNQKIDGLCTAECIIELLKINGDEKNANLLEEKFELFNKS